MRGITAVRWYKVIYTVNGIVKQDIFSCFMNIDAEIEINSELDDKYRGDDREILEITPTEQPENIF